MHSRQFEHEYVSELNQARADAMTLIPAFTELARAASDPELADAFKAHVNDLSRQVDRLAEITPSMTVAPGADAIVCLTAKAARLVASREPGAIRDTAMIAAVQHIQHYQIATYGTLAAYARMLDHHDEKRILGALLEDARAVDEDLTVIASAILEPEEAVAA